ncbi:hypothetical protein FOZ63_022206 [Perkinsus olseni]|uniref:Uncharacterized protein n=1 Tax=Perkinsus olseni TaxID=32597 RepID=A0A7J6TBP4_PEROL|nr:hypothetical protein FOZ63_022206 [Perkinsus olseni]KAF4751130.1 hypothetical protein FOZ62_001702 [Perkinsus olseni]
MSRFGHVITFLLASAISVHSGIGPAGKEFCWCDYDAGYFFWLASEYRLSFSNYSEYNAISDVITVKAENTEAWPAAKSLRIRTAKYERRKERRLSSRVSVSSYTAYLMLRKKSPFFLNGSSRVAP